MKGPKGTRSFTATDDVTLTIDGAEVKVAPRGNSKRARAMWGMTRTQVQNLVTGVSDRLPAKRWRSRASATAPRCRARTCNWRSASRMTSIFEVPDGVTVATPKPTEIVVEGIDQQLVGQVAANIREWRPPEPYKGKGIRYKGEYIFRKEGKKK